MDDSVLLSDRYRIETRIVVWEGKDVLVIPLSALFRCETGSKRLVTNTWCTFVVENDHAQRSNFQAAIAAGLNEGEVVILHPTEQIQSGKRVTPR